MSCTFWLKRRKEKAARKAETPVENAVVDKATETPVETGKKQKQSAKKAVTEDDNA